MENILTLLTALGLGTLIGIERSFSGKDGNDPNGLRTYILLALLGYISAWFNHNNDSSISIIIFSLIGGFMLIKYFLENSQNNCKYLGFTSEFSAIITYGLGLMSFYNTKLASIITVIVIMILFLKDKFRDFSKKISQIELMSIIKFVIMAFVIYPVLPTQAIDPWGVIIPTEVWLMVILISGISFIGYVLTKIIGEEKGIIISGLLGGLVSSTATTSSLSTQSQEHSKLEFVLAAGVIAASSIMFGRIALAVLFVNKTL
nr:DUF4010 domain-containing protein [Candidatus Gracilibacteria bacterium]